MGELVQIQGCPSLPHLSACLAQATSSSTVNTWCSLGFPT